MIRNIEDEKKNLKQCQNSGVSGYLSDEELYELVGHIEEKEMLHAPAHLKENVIAQIRRKRRNAGKRQVFVYRSKVLVAMAAALAVLILMPYDHADIGDGIFIEQREDKILEQMDLERQRGIDAGWKRYLEERESGGVRGFFRGINEKLTEFGTEKLYIDMKLWR